MWSAESGSFWIVMRLTLTPAAAYAARYLDVYSAYDSNMAASSSMPGLAELRM